MANLKGSINVLFVKYKLKIVCRLLFIDLVLYGKVPYVLNQKKDSCVDYKILKSMK